jgi:NAD(P)-dependent dehydrogenase (short-subunit alcohol dehydrogenase family)
MPFLPALSGSKAALSAMSDAIRLELAAWNIPVVVIEPGATDTAIFSKAGAAARASLATADPAVVALYRHRLDAVATATGKQRTAPAEQVAKTIVAAVAAKSPKRHYTTGSDARLAGIVAGLPAGLRERMIGSLLGLRKADRERQ